jgi:hypothetical protein
MVSEPIYQIALFDHQSEDDITELRRWLMERSLPDIPSGILPALSIWITFGGDKAAFCAVYMDNSVNVAHLMWITTNPDLPATVTAGALYQLSDAAEELCRAHGYHVIFSTAGVRSVVKMLRKKGFVDIHDHTVSLLKLITD